MNRDYQELIHKIGEKRFDSRFKELLKQINAFLDEAKYDNNVQCNERILYHVLLDYYSDIVRLKDFHDIQYTKTDKVMAYLIHWIVRRKPIQLKEFSDNEKDIFVNERFACYKMINECLLQPVEENLSIKLSPEEITLYDKYIDLLLYYFKYRQVSPQVIELLIETFKIGRLFPTGKISDEKMKYNI